MVRARPFALVVTGLVGFVAVFLGLRLLNSRGGLFPAPVILPVLVAGFAVVLAVLGWRVRLYVRRKADMEPVAAARVAALAVSAAYVGALMVGVGIAEVLAVLGYRGSPLAHRDYIVGGTTALVSAVLLAVALLVQHWCRVGEGDDDPGATGGSEGSTA